MKVAVILVVSLLLPTVVLGADSPTPFPFKLGKDKFDETMATYYAKGMERTVEYAEKPESDCDLAKLIRDVKEIPLNDMLDNNEALRLKALDIYTKIQDNPDVSDAFNCAFYLAQEQKPNNERKFAWNKFRREVAPNQLVLIRNKLFAQAQEGEPTTYKDPELNPDFLKNLFILNKDVSFNEQQELIWHACNIVLFTFRQNHRLADPESDFATLPKSITEDAK